MGFSKKEGRVCIWSPEGAIEGPAAPSRTISSPEQVTLSGCHCPWACVPLMSHGTERKGGQLKGAKVAGAQEWLQGWLHAALPQGVPRSCGG